MQRKSKMLAVFCLLFLLLFSLTSPVFACQIKQVEGTGGQQIPIEICLQKDAGKGEVQPIVCRFEVPLNNEVMKIIPKVNRIIYKLVCKAPEPAPEPEPEPIPEPPVSEPNSILSADEMQMWQLINGEREKAGLKPLQIHEELVNLARLKSEDMVKLGYFSHQSPTYGSPFEMITKAGITYRTAGENIAGAPTVSRAHQALMNSPGHRANILNASFTHVGIGIVDGGPYGKMYTQIFIGQR